MSFPIQRLEDFLSFTNGRSSPERSNLGQYRVFGSNGAIGWADVSNAPPSTIVIGRVGTYCGSVHFAQDASWVTDNAIKCVPKDKGEGRFWYYALLLADLGRLRSGSGQPLINQRALSSIELPVPASSIRIAISNILGSLDDKIELNRQMNETLEAMAQSIFRDWFVDFGPTCRKLEGATDPVEIMGGLVSDAQRAQQLADLFPSSLNDNGLPAGWVEADVASVSVLLKRGLTPSYNDDGVLVVNQKCIRGSKVNFNLARRHNALKRAPKERTLEEYDVLINSTGVGTLGRVATVRGLDEPATADSHVTICRANTDKVSKLFLSLFLERQQSVIETLGQGSTGQTELSVASVGALALPIAPRSVQTAFEELVLPLRELSTENDAQSKTLATTRDLLLPKLMSGEIELRDVEGQLEAAQ